MAVSLESFVDGYLYPGQLMQLSGTGPSEDDNPVRYEGSCNEIPKEYLAATVAFVTMNGNQEDPYTLRIECDFQSAATDCVEALSLKDFLQCFAYPGQEVEVSGIGPDVDGNYVRYEGASDDIPEDILEKTVRYVASAAHPEAPHILRIECEF